MPRRVIFLERLFAVRITFWRLIGSRDPIGNIGKRVRSSHVALAPMLNHIFGKPLHPDLPSRLCGGEKIVNLCLEPSDSRYSLIWSLRSLFSGIISDISWTIDLRGAHFEAQGIENIPSHRKSQFFHHHKVFKERVAAILTPNSLWGFELRRHDHS